MNKPENCPGEYDPDSDICKSCYSIQECIQSDPKNLAKYMNAAMRHNPLRQLQKYLDPKREETIDDYMELILRFNEAGKEKLGEDRILYARFERDFFEYFQQYLQVFTILKGQEIPLDPPKPGGIPTAPEIPNTFPEELLQDGAGDDPKESVKWWQEVHKCPKCGGDVKIVADPHFFKAYCLDRKECKWTFTLPEHLMKEFFDNQKKERQDDGPEQEPQD